MNEAAYDVSRLGDDSLPLSVLRGYVNAESRVLEIGCANGLNLERLRREVGCTGTGVDPSAAAIDAGSREFPALDLRRGTADALPFGDEVFDVVLFGFCLYVTDRPLLPRVVAESDRVLADGGFLVIVDFDPPHPVRRAYRHAAGVTTYKMDYSLPFLGFPHFLLAEKRAFSHSGSLFEPDGDERLAIHVLHKDLSAGFLELD